MIACFVCGGVIELLIGLAALALGSEFIDRFRVRRKKSLDKSCKCGKIE